MTSRRGHDRPDPLAMTTRIFFIGPRPEADGPRWFAVLLANGASSLIAGTSSLPILPAVSHISPTVRHARTHSISGHIVFAVPRAASRKAFRADPPVPGHGGAERPCASPAAPGCAVVDFTASDGRPDCRRDVDPDNQLLTRLTACWCGVTPRRFRAAETRPRSRPPSRPAGQWRRNTARAFFHVESGARGNTIHRADRPRWRPRFRGR